MGMNKQLKVTFNVTATLSDEQEAELVKEELGKECARTVDEFVLKVAPAKVEVIR